MRLFSFFIYLQTILRTFFSTLQISIRYETSKDTSLLFKTTDCYQLIISPLIVKPDITPIPIIGPISYHRLETEQTSVYCWNTRHSNTRTLSIINSISVYDASAKSPNGLLWGATFQMGNFDECISVGREADNTHVVGQYCLANVHFKKSAGDSKKVNVSTVIHIYLGLLLIRV